MQFGRSLAALHKTCFAFLAFSSDKMAEYISGELGCTFDEAEMVARIEADIAYSKGVNAAHSGDALE